MFNIFKRQKSTVQNVQTVNSLFNTFLDFHNKLCTNDRSNANAHAASFKEVQGLNKILEILVEEDKEMNDSRMLKPCMEFIMTSKIFEILTSVAQMDKPKGLLVILIKFYKGILKKVVNQDYMYHMSFHSSLSSILHILNALLSSFSQDYRILVLSLISSILQKIYSNEALLDLFIYKTEKKAEFLPLSILMLYFSDEFFYQYKHKPFIILSKIRDPNILKLMKENELVLTITTKLAFYFQQRNIEAIKLVSSLFQEFYANSSSKSVQEDLVDSFYENFCVPILTPRLQSKEYSIRLNTSILLSIVIQEITSVPILMAIVYFFQGKEKDGSVRLKALVSTPTGSSKKSFDFKGDLNKGCKQISDISKMWDTLIDNLNSKYEKLSIYTLKIVYYLLSQGGKKVVKLLITDYFSGSPPTDDVLITAELFLTFIPPSVMPVGLSRNFSDYLSSGYLKCSQALMSSSIPLHEFSEHTGDIYSKPQTGETGGTNACITELQEDRNQKFFEGEILHTVLIKFKNFLNNQLDENLYVTGIISTLSSFPKELGSFASLHNFLLEPQTKGSKGNFLTHLKHLALDIDVLVSSDEAFPNKIESTAREMGVVNKSTQNDSFMFLISDSIRGKKSKSLVIEDNKQNLEAIVVFQEFIKEMASILVFKELLDDMSNRAKKEEEEYSLKNK